MPSIPKKNTVKSSGTFETHSGEKEVRSQIETMQYLMDSYPGSLFSIDRNYHYTAFNSIHSQRMQAIYGAEIEIGHNLLEYITVPKDREASEKNLRRAFAGEQFIETAYSISDQGNEVFFNIHHTPIKNEKGVVNGVCVFLENVTALKKSKDAQKEAEELYGNLFREISSIILIIDVESKSILEANQAACAFYGYTHSELTALKISDLAVLSPEELHSHVQKVANSEAKHLQHAHRLANGEIRDVDISVGATTFNGRQVNVSIIHDISANKAAEDALKLSEERYKSQFKKLPLAAYTWQHKGDDFILVDYNDSAIAKTEGLVTKLLGKFASELYKDEPEVLADLSNCFNKQSTIQREIKTPLHSTGVIRDLIVTYVYISSDLVQVHAEDITERKIAEEKLHANEELLRKVFESSQDAIVVTSTDGTILAANPSACRMSGMTEEEMILAGRNKFFNTNDPALVLILEEFKHTGKFFGVLNFIRKDGTTFPGEISSISYKDGDGNILTSSIIRDISERVLVEREKAEAEFRYHALFEQSHDAIFILDFNGVHLTTNQRAADMMGYSLEEMHGLSVNETSAEINKSRQAIQQLLRGEHIPAYERLFKKKDGTIFPVEINVELVRDSHGNPLHIQSVVRDISERKEAERKLIESEEKYRSFVENSFDGITFVDEQGNVTEWNRAAEDLTGLKKEEVLGKPYWDIQMRFTLPEHKTAEYLERIKTNMLEMIQTGESPLFNRIHTAEFIRADGTRRTVEQIIFSIKKKNGYGVRSMARDITERKQAEEKLRESEERFRLLFEKSQAIMMIIEPVTGKILDANPATKTFYGYSLEELRNMSIDQINTLPPKTVASERQLALEEKRNFFVFPHRLKNGEMRTVEVHSSPIQLKGRTVLFSIIHDVTKKKQAEEKLIESEERFSTAFHSSLEAISISRLSDGVYIDVNDAFCSIFELSRVQVIGRTGKELDLWVEPLEKANLLMAFREIGKVPSFEREYRTKTGRTGFVQASIGLTYLAGEQCLLMFGRDITARKEAEEKLRAAHEELEQRVRERTAELQTAIASLEKASKVKDEFLSSMGHELRTPLNVILGSAQMLEESIYGPLNEKQIRTVTAIENSGENLLRTINDILDYTKLQNREVSPTISTCSLGDLCRSVLKLTASLSEKKRQQVSFSITPETIMLQTDELRIQQIIFTLLNNAVKFTPSGGKVGIDVVGHQKTKQIKISVWDNGIGIKNEDLPRLFHPFAQLDARLAREYEGSGLGLALSKLLVELFGGSISVESVYGEGSKFIVTLPWME